MDFGYLINILSRRKWLLLSIVLIASVATWFFIGKLPDVYKAKSVIATGIIDYKGVSLQKDNPFIQKFQIESSFNGLIEKMRSRTTLQLLTDRLLLHDLQADGVREKPFRTPEGDDLHLTTTERDNIVLKMKTSLTDTMMNKKPHVDVAGNKVAEAYEYDYETLLKKLAIQRVGETDLLTVEYESENPELSYFVVETFLHEFFKMHEKDLSYKEDVAVDFQTRQLQERKAALDSMVNAINVYKNANRLVDVSTQQESVISHMKELEINLAQQQQLVPALRGQIKILNGQIMKYNRELGGYLAGNIHFSEDYKRISDQITKLQDQYVEYIASGKNTDAISLKIEKLQKDQSQYIGKIVAVSSTRKEKLDDHVQDWIKESLEKSLELELAESAVKSYTSEIARQQGRATKLLYDDNQLTTMQAEKDRIEKEYLSTRAEYDQAKLYSEGSENPLSIIEPVFKPDEPESKHRTVFSVFAGVASGSLASILFFILAFMDSSMQSPMQYHRVTRLPLLAYVNQLKTKNLRLDTLFATSQNKAELEIFKENIRKLRTAILGSGAQTFLFVSPKEGEGKSFLTLLLAYSLSLSDKKVLIIDTNFKHNTLSAYRAQPYYELYPEGNMQPAAPGQEKADAYLKNIEIVPNKGGSQSPSEVLAGKKFDQVMRQYAARFDYIFLEAAAMNTFSDARELLPYVEKVVAVFSSESPIGSADKATIEVLRSFNDKMFGGILNKIDMKNV